MIRITYQFLWRQKRRPFIWLVAIIASVLTATCVSHAAELAKIDLPVLTSPSLSDFVPPVIKAKGFDRANGLNLNIIIKTAESYRTDFAAGTNKIGGSGTVLADVAKLNEKGVKVVYLFNVFDFWGTVVVPASSNIRTLKDLEGKTMAAALPTTNYVMFRYFAETAGVDLSKVAVQNSTVPGLVALAASGRVDAVEMWEPAYSILTYGNNKFRAIDVVTPWKKRIGENSIPYLGVAAHADWVQRHKPLIPKLYKAYESAAEFIQEHPDAAAKIISADSQGRLNSEILSALIKSGHLGLSVYWGGARPRAARKIFEAAVASHYLDHMPTSNELYDGK